MRVVPQDPLAPEGGIQLMDVEARAHTLEILAGMMRRQRTDGVAGATKPAGQCSSTPSAATGRVGPAAELAAIDRSKALQDMQEHYDRMIEGRNRRVVSAAAAAPGPAGEGGQPRPLDRVGDAAQGVYAGQDVTSRPGPVFRPIPAPASDRGPAGDGRGHGAGGGRDPALVVDEDWAVAGEARLAGCHSTAGPPAATARRQGGGRPRLAWGSVRRSSGSAAAAVACARPRVT